MPSGPRSRRRWLLALALLGALGAGGYYLARDLLGRRGYDRALEASRRYDLEEALAHAEQAAALRPRHAPTYLLAGRLSRQLSRYDEAEQFRRRYAELEKTGGRELQLEALLVTAARG